MTGLHVPVGYGGELRIGTVRVPDERIDNLSRIFSPKKTTFAEMIFSDIPASTALISIVRREPVAEILRRRGDQPSEPPRSYFCIAA
jgi:hypothetical protein